MSISSHRLRNLFLLGLIVGLGIVLSGMSLFRVAENKAVLKRDLQSKAVYMAVEPEEIVAGDPHARVVVLEYFDFDCPFCKTYYETQESLLMEEYLHDSVAFARRHMPLVYLHPNAYVKAQMLECAIAQEPKRYADAAALLFKNPFTNLDAYSALFVRALNLQNEELRTCLTDGSTDAVIGKDMAKGALHNVSSTPTFIIFKDGVERARVAGNRLPQLDTSIRLLLTEK